MSEIINWICFIFMFLLFCMFPFAPLIVWMLADKFGVLDRKRESEVSGNEYDGE